MNAPSAMWRTRSAASARAGSCVEATMVMPCCWTTSRSTEMMPAPVVESRSPVGSSARRTGGPTASGPGDGDPALLAAGELVGAVAPPGAQPRQLQGLHGPPLPLPPGHPVDAQGQVHVLVRREDGEQAVHLEHEPHLVPAQLRQRPVRRLRQVQAVEDDRSAGRAVQSAQKVEQRGLAGSGAAHERQELPAPDVEVHSLERGDVGCPGLEDAHQVHGANDGRCVRHACLLGGVMRAPSSCGSTRALPRSCRCSTVSRGSCRRPARSTTT